MASKTARQTIKRRDQDSESEPWWTEKYCSNEIVGIFLVGLAAILLLSFISYSTVDLPEWVSFKPEVGEASNFEGNLVGPVGTVISGYLYFAFGAASWIFPAVLVWWAIQIVTTKRKFRFRHFLTLAVLVTAMACIIDCQGMFFQKWVARYDLPQSPGGITGFTVGDQLLVRFFGPGGCFILMAITSILSLVVITGIHPYRFCRKLGSSFARIFRRVDWEKKWSLWSGYTPKEETYAISRALPVSDDVITLAPVMTESFAEQPQPTQHTDEQSVAQTVICPSEEVAADSEDSPAAKAPAAPASATTSPVPPTPAPAPAKPSPERVRKIVDSTQKHHRAAGAENADNFNIFDANPRYEGYQLPTLDLLNYADEIENVETDDETLIQIQNNIIRTLHSFKVEVEAGDITKGPTVTRFEVYPSPGLRVNKITALKDDIARATRAERINILAPIPGKDTVGIEMANTNKVTVALRELFENEAFRNSKGKLPLVLGKDVYGETIIGDLARMPHLLVAGATGSGKSVCINSIIASLLYRFSPDELKFIMIDPKVVEMQLYNALPHMVIPVVTEPKKVIMALRWVIKEMESRYSMFAKKGVRSFDGYNSLRAKEVRGEEQAAEALLQPNLFDTETGEDIFLSEQDEAAKTAATDSTDNDLPVKLPYIVVIIDELADLMQTAPADVETSIARIAQKARAAGIHLVIATQTPRADVVTGIIKANVPSRIAFQVSSKTDSRIILDENGAENLVGKGDMLYLPPGSAQLIRAQGALITDEEAQSLVDACAAQGSPNFEIGDDSMSFGFMEDEKSEVSDADEECISKCMEVIFTEKKASTSLLQRKLRLGYTRAARMIDILEDRGIIGPGDGAKPREILIDLAVD